MDELSLLKQRWDEIKNIVKRDHEITDIAFKTWIIPLELYSIENDVISILIPSEQATGVNYISNKYKSAFVVTISELMQKEYDVVFISNNEIKKSEPVSSNIMGVASKIINSNLNPKYTFDTFIVGSNNRLAHSAALAVSEDPGKIYNPLFIYGGPGLGKTHLMHSIGHYVLKKNPNLNVCYVTSETFTNELIESIRSGSNQTMSKFRDKYRSVDVLLLDDVQFIIGKESTQEEFFNTFNVLYTANKAIILSSDKPPKDIETLEERMRSRFDWGLTVDINPPDYETRMAILRKYAETMNEIIDDDIITYIASNIKSNIRELEGALNKIIAVQKMQGEKITLQAAIDAIKDMITPDEPKKITPQIIINEVAKYYNIEPNEISSQKRNKEIVIPRQVAMYLCREKTDVALAEIGNIMGKRDHTTVIHGHEKISKELSTDNGLKADVDEIIKKLYPT